VDRRVAGRPDLPPALLCRAVCVCRPLPRAFGAPLRG